MAPHKPRKSAPIECTMNEEDMIVYDMEDEPEPNPDYFINITEIEGGDTSPTPLLIIYLSLLHLPHPQHVLFLKLPPLHPIPYLLHPRIQKKLQNPVGKKRPPKNTSNTIKPQIEIKMAPHKPRKSAPIECTMNEEDMIVYDMEDEPEPNPDYFINITGVTYKGELVKKPNYTFICYDYEILIRKQC
ncbi:hypothetical protein TNCV_1439551 [Trichonephila clavipes]|nr:hypothetical protein TNCV_1439551 [Trichonephila clavipes]